MHRTLNTLAVIAALTAVNTSCAATPPASSSCATLAVTDGRQATSLLGKPMFSPEIPDERRGQLEANLDMAKRQHEANPSDEAAAIWHGRRLAYLGRFREAIDVYTAALKTHPDSHRLLRHRGHRHITCRNFDQAIADLSRAWTLAKDRPDAPEPDGEGAPGAAPSSTDKSNIIYHLGLAHYLKGEFATAANTFALRSEITPPGGRLNDDTLVSFLNWHYLSMVRAGDKDSAMKVLDEYRHDMQIRDNGAYFALLRVYAGEVPADVLAPAVQTGQSTSLAMAYGVAAYRLVCGDREHAERLMTKLTEHPLWPSFGVIAAEADLARSRSASVDTVE